MVIFYTHIEGVKEKLAKHIKNIFRKEEVCMLDIKFIRRSPEDVKNALKRRKMDPSIIDTLLGKDEKRRKIIAKADELKKIRNEESKKIGRLKKEGKDISEASAKVKKIGEEIKALDEERKLLEEEIEEILIRIPNIPSPDVPDGEDDSFNVEIRRWGDVKEFTFTPLPHWEIGEKLGIIDIPRAVKMAKTRFVMMKGAGAMLERALINFMLDFHTSRGYTEIFPPFIVNQKALYGTGQLPKFEEDLFELTNGLYLIPTAEVPLTNIHADEILKAEDLPLYYCGYSACFRSEAGAAGRDTRGLTRVHQFNKVELVKICKPEDSKEELEKMLSDAEAILQALNIPYRVMAICIGDLGFSAHFKYDLEYWAPGQKRWVEVSSCSNCTDFQARRANIKFKEKKGKPQFVHTLNGSGLAVGRTVAAILENYQREDGTVEVPEVLQKYMKNMKIITPS